MWQSKKVIVIGSGFAGQTAALYLGDSLWDGSAAVIIAHPIVPDWKKYPVSGRDMFVSNMEMGLSGA